MVHIRAKDVTLEFPLLDSQDVSLKQTVLRILSFRNLVQNYVQRISPLTFAIEEGDRVGLFGPNGAGKTSLLRLFAGIYSPTSGSLNIEGARRSILGLSAGVNPELSALDNIKLLLSIDGMTPTDDLVEEVWDFVDLEREFLYQPIKIFSSGMQMRLLFSVSTVGPVDILLLDEWLSVADEKFHVRAQERMNELVDKTSILVLASHSKPLLESVCNKIVYMADGKITKVEML